MPKPQTNGGAPLRQCAASLVLALLSGSCSDGGGRSSPTAPEAPPTAPSATQVAGSMIDPRSDATIGNATLEYTNPDGSPGRFLGGTFRLDIRPGTSVAVSAPGYESRTIGPTPDGGADSYFMRYTADARFNERFREVALSLGNSTQRLSGTCLRGETPTPLELQVAAPDGYRSSIRLALATLSTLTRGAYDLVNAPIGSAQNWTPQSGILKIYVAPTFYQTPCYPAASCTLLVGDPPQILGASIVLGADRTGKGTYFQLLVARGLAFVAGARGYTDTGGLMDTSETKFEDRYDTWTFNTLYCLPIGYSPGSMTAATSAGTALPFELEPGSPGTFAGRRDPRVRSSQPDADANIDRGRPPER